MGFGESSSIYLFFFHIYMFYFSISSMTKRDREVVDFTRSRIKNKSKLTNLMKIIRIEAYNGK